MVSEEILKQLEDVTQRVFDLVLNKARNVNASAKMLGISQAKLAKQYDRENRLSVETLVCVANAFPSVDMNTLIRGVALEPRQDVRMNAVDSPHAIQSMNSTINVGEVASWKEKYERECEEVEKLNKQLAKQQAWLDKFIIGEVSNG